MKHIRLFIAGIMLFLGISTALVPSLAMAAADTPTTPKSDVCNALGSGDDCTTGGSGTTLNNTVKVALEILSTVVGIAAVIMIIVGGFRYITSGGDSNSISSAKNTILYALIGLVIVAFAQGIVLFVLNRAAAPNCPVGQVVNYTTETCVAAPK